LESQKEIKAKYTKKSSDKRNNFILRISPGKKVFKKSNSED